MQELSEKQSGTNGRNRPKKVLNGDAIVFHNTHIKNGKQKDSRCGYCKSGVAAVVRTVTPRISEPVEGNGVDESDRDHEERDAPSAFTDELWQT